MQIDTKPKIASLHYITQEVEGFSHAQLAEQACLGGVNWVQLRVKGKSYDEWLEIAYETKAVCDKYKASLIINDNVRIAKLISASGVHLGREDMSPLEAREILGDSVFIGGTANNLEEACKLREMPVDYIGLGPYRFTSTKEKLSPVLGPERIKVITDAVGHSIPFILIGGITLSDVDLIMDTGVHGIAVSSAINHAEDKRAAAFKFIEKLEHYN